YCARRALHSFPTRRSSDLERAAALGDGGEISPGDLPPEVLLSASLPPDSFHGQVEDYRRRLIVETLARCGGNQTRAAEALKLQRDRKSTRLNSSHDQTSYA